MHDEVLLVAVLIEASEEIHALITPEEPFDALHCVFGKLSGEQLPVTVLNLQESGQVVRLMLHESDKASIQLLVSFNLVLKLALLMPVKLLFIHW